MEFDSYFQHPVVVLLLRGSEEWEELGEQLHVEVGAFGNGRRVKRDNGTGCFCSSSPGKRKEKPGGMPSGWRKKGGTKRPPRT